MHLPTGLDISRFQHGYIDDDESLAHSRTKFERIISYPAFGVATEGTKDAIYTPGGLYGREENVQFALYLEDPSLIINIDDILNNQDDNNKRKKY